MDSEQDNFDDEEGSGPPQPDLLKSYLAFGMRAIKARRLLAASLFVVGVALTICVVSVWPRTYHCEMRLLSQRSQALGDEAGTNPLTGASDVIMRRENLQQIVQQTDLPRLWKERRPGLLKLKDSLASAIGGKPSDEAIASSLVNFVGQRISSNVDGNTLAISADWSDGETAAKVVEAAYQTFMASRHAAEISTLQDKISILEDHAAKAKDDIDRLAEQLQRVREQKLAEAGKSLKVPDPPATSAAPPVLVAPRPIRPLEPDESLKTLKDELEQKKRMIADLEADRNRRLLEAQAKVSELQLRYTPAHPQVRAAEQIVASLNEESPRVTALKTEVQGLEKAIRDKGSQPRFEGGGTVSGPRATAAQGADVLSADVIKILESGAGIDPAVNAQLSGAIAKYGSLRDAIGTARIALDTAQAAFNYRYKVILPPEVPIRPSKPKIPVIMGGGIFAALLLALLIPVLLELRRGVIVEKWQVYQMQLPILAEIKYPPGALE